MFTRRAARCHVDIQRRVVRAAGRLAEPRLRAEAAQRTTAQATGWHLPAGAGQAAELGNLQPYLGRSPSASSDADIPPCGSAACASLRVPDAFRPPGARLAALWTLWKRFFPLDFVSVCLVFCRASEHRGSGFPPGRSSRPPVPAHFSCCSFSSSSDSLMSLGVFF